MCRRLSLQSKAIRRTLPSVYAREILEFTNILTVRLVFSRGEKQYTIIHQAELI